MTSRVPFEFLLVCKVYTLPSKLPKHSEQEVSRKRKIRTAAATTNPLPCVLFSGLFML